MKRLPFPVCALVALHLAVLPCKGDILDPSAFASLGAFPTLAGTYNVDTSTATPTILLPGGGSLQGVIYNGLAVFDFDSINITQGMSFFDRGNEGTPLVLLSRGNAVIAGTVDVSALGSTGGPGGFSGTHFPYETSGPGGGNSGLVAADHLRLVGAGGGGGGGFGGPGSNGQNIPNFTLGGGAGGPAYGDITKKLEGGSAGGTAFKDVQGTWGPGGGGGGAVEIGALGTLTVSGTIKANGGYSAAVPPPSGVGAGSGGAILLHGNSVVLGGTLSALGGLSGGSPNPDLYGVGGAGGGGRIAVLYYSSYNQDGVINIGNGSLIVAAVPEPSPLWLSAVVSVAGLTGYLWSRGRGSKL
jgi:hypothetical protein